MRIHLLTFWIIGLLAISFSACNRAKQKAKDTISQTGEVVGKGASEFVNGISEGIDQTFECKLSVSTDLLEKGIQTGKFKITGSTLASKNKLSIYIIFNRDFNDVISIKVFDSKGLEYGRTRLAIKASAGEATYYDFEFDSPTALEKKSVFIIEEGK